MAKRMTKAEKILEKMAERVAMRSTCGNPVNIFWLSAIHNRAKEALMVGATEAEAETMVRGYIVARHAGEEAA